MANSIFLFPGGIQMSGGGSITVPIGGQFLAPDGSNTLPGYSFALETNTGWYRPSAGTIQFSGAGTAGPTVTASQVNIPAGGAFRSSGNGTKILFPADGQVVLQNNAGTDFSLLNFGGTTSSFPALRRSSLTGAQSIDARLGDNSGGAEIGALRFIVNAQVCLGGAVADGVLVLQNFGSTDFNRINFGGNTSAFPALKRSAATLQVKLADDSALGTIESATSIISSKAFIGSGFISAITPTISSGFGTSPSIVSGGVGMAFRVNVGTGGTASGGVIAMNTTAPNGWNAYVENITGTAANRANVRTVVTAGSTTTVTVQNQTISTGAAVAWTASDILLVIAFAW